MRNSVPWVSYIQCVLCMCLCLPPSGTHRAYSGVRDAEGKGVWGKSSHFQIHTWETPETLRATVGEDQGWGIGALCPLPLAGRAGCPFPAPLPTAVSGQPQTARGGREGLCWREFWSRNPPPMDQGEGTPGPSLSHWTYQRPGVGLQPEHLPWGRSPSQPHQGRLRSVAPSDGKCM